MTELETIAALRAGAPYRNDRFVELNRAGGVCPVCILTCAVRLLHPGRLLAWVNSGATIDDTACADMLGIPVAIAASVSFENRFSSLKAIDVLAREWAR